MRSSFQGVKVVVRFGIVARYVFLSGKMAL